MAFYNPIQGKFKFHVYSTEYGDGVRYYSTYLWADNFEHARKVFYEITEDMFNTMIVTRIDMDLNVWHEEHAKNNCM